MDGEGEYTCETWGELGEPGIPVLIDTDQFFLWFILDGYPDFVILDHNMVVAYKFAELDFDSVNTQIQIALDNCQQCETTDISHNQEVMPEAFQLHPNYPNPFNPNTAIKYSLGTNSFVNLTIFDLSGNIIKTLVNKSQVQGIHFSRWNGLNENGNRVPSGMYFIKIKSGAYSQSRKMVFLK